MYKQCLCCSGLAAGFDKDADAVKGLLGLGFGFVEVGELPMLLATCVAAGHVSVPHVLPISLCVPCLLQAQSHLFHSQATQSHGLSGCQS